jgi:Predicted hydrolases of the HAD superfamily
MVKVAVDFDGTIVENAYPAIGQEMLFAFETMKLLQRKGFHLILWTYRDGKPLEEAVEFCRQHGVEFYAVNKNYAEEVLDDTVSRKIDADIYIDDKNLGGFPGWTKVWEMLCPEETAINPMQERRALKKGRKSFWNIFRR